MKHVLQRYVEVVLQNLQLLGILLVVMLAYF